MVDSAMTWLWGRWGRCLGVVTRRRACLWHVRGVGTAIQAPVRAVIHGHRLVESPIYHVGHGHIRVHRGLRDSMPSMTLGGRPSVAALRGLSTGPRRP